MPTAHQAHELLSRQWGAAGRCSSHCGCVRDLQLTPAAGGLDGLGWQPIGEVHREDVALRAQVIERQPAHPQLVDVPVLPPQEPSRCPSPSISCWFRVTPESNALRAGLHEARFTFDISCTGIVTVHVAVNVAFLSPLV